MTTTPRMLCITERLTQAFSPTYLEVVDESDAHHGHAGHHAGGSHFKVEITAPMLAPLTRVEAHRKIYAVLADLIPHEIHALRIILRPF
ncbi:MAG TPA: BolA family protein [Gammaproteobacteria bacterium]|jgi:BolA protein|nr:BolA family protein [Gammaproteobacteria bacterium]